MATAESFAADHRADPRLVALFTQFGLDAVVEQPPLSRNDPLDALHEYADRSEAAFEQLFAATADGLPPIDVDRSTETIVGEAGNEITLYISRPHGQTDPLPGILHLHGGGMAILHAGGPTYGRWRDSLAAAGAVVVGVEFRNSGGAFGRHPFPAGLNDCASALDWMHAQRSALGLSSIVVSGESGGGNLTLATAIKAKGTGQIDGVYAIVPYIAGAYGTDEFPSQAENDGYFVTTGALDLLAHLYDPSGAYAMHPQAWPLRASTEDLAGLPPTVITTDELDPLRDEGLAMLRKLQAAGVDASGHVIAGMCHAGEMLVPSVAPRVYATAVRDIVGFATLL